MIALVKKNKCDIKKIVPVYHCFKRMTVNLFFACLGYKLHIIYQTDTKCFNSLKGQGNIKKYVLSFATFQAISYVLLRIFLYSSPCASITQSVNFSILSQPWPKVKKESQPLEICSMHTPSFFHAFLKAEKWVTAADRIINVCVFRERFNIC